MTLGERVVVISFVVALVLVTAFGVFAFMFPEQLPWYGDPSPRTPLPRSSLWEGVLQPGFETSGWAYSGSQL
jgi:hypothetical protein